MIRRMTAADVEQVSVNEARCFSSPWSQNAFLDALTRPDVLYLVAEEEQKVVGHCGVRKILDEGEITNVAVLPECRGRGIGKQLLSQLLCMGEAMGIRHFTLEVRCRNQAAIHIYEKAGFASEGVRPGFYEKPKEDALIMWKRQPE